MYSIIAVGDHSFKAKVMIKKEKEKKEKKKGKKKEEHKIMDHFIVQI